MPTSDPIRGPRNPAILALEALGLALAFGLLPDVLWGGSRPDGGPHPVWIAVLVLSARYGTPGFIGGLGAGAVAIGTASAISAVPAPGQWARFAALPDLMLLGGCLIVAWIAGGHLRRETELRVRAQALRERASDADSIIAALRDVLETQRARLDRCSTSLSFLRNVAARLEGTDPVAAAEGAADLALVRTGATAVAVLAGSNGDHSLLAVRDVRGPSPLESREIRDADASVPIHAAGTAVGTIAIWGLPHSARNGATDHDLEVIASWCAPALSRSSRRPDGTAAAAGRRQ